MVVEIEDVSKLVVSLDVVGGAGSVEMDVVGWGVVVGTVDAWTVLVIFRLFSSFKLIEIK